MFFMEFMVDRRLMMTLIPRYQIYKDHKKIWKNIFLVNTFFFLYVYCVRFTKFLHLSCHTCIAYGLHYKIMYF